MREAFAAAIDAIFADRNVGEDALWRSGGIGDAVPVRVVRRSPDALVGFGDSRAVMPSVLIDARRPDVSDPAAGDTVEIAGNIYEVIAAPVADSLGLVWTCEASLSVSEASPETSMTIEVVAETGNPDIYLDHGAGFLIEG
jgi:hypothetical protein